PFSNKEMVYRVNAQLRRYFEYNKNASQAERQYGELFISSTYMQAKVGGEVIPLTAKEFKLLDFLTKNENCLFGKQKLIDEVWGLEEYIDENTVAVTVARLREKLEAKGVNHIVTVWGLGYKWQY
ncbi:MAG: response regulator transcription factor, partial [Clostridia bacterium]|nr:response regulator transcription factor [Clostridia bacterium]